MTIILLMISSWAIEAQYVSTTHTVTSMGDTKMFLWVSKLISSTYSTLPLMLISDKVFPMLHLISFSYRAFFVVDGQHFIKV